MGVKNGSFVVLCRSIYICIAQGRRKGRVRGVGRHSRPSFFSFFFSFFFVGGGGVGENFIHFLYKV